MSTIVGNVMFERGDAIALVYSTVMRNLSIALADVIQVQSAAWYVNFTDKIFGPPVLESRLTG